MKFFFTDSFDDLVAISADYASAVHHVGGNEGFEDDDERSGLLLYDHSEQGYFIAMPFEDAKAFVLEAIKDATVDVGANLSVDYV